MIDPSTPHQPDTYQTSIDRPEADRLVADRLVADGPVAGGPEAEAAAIDLTDVDRPRDAVWTLCRKVDPTPIGGVDPRSRYVDHFWIPTMGPTAVCLARALMRMIAREGDTVAVQAEHLRAMLGLHGPNAVHDVHDAISVLIEHDIVDRSVHDDGSVTIHVYTQFPYLSDDLVAQLPGDLGVAHRAPYSLRAAATLDAPLDRARELGPHLRILSLASTVDEILVNPALDAGQLAFRWQHVLRLAEEARDDAVLDWAPADLESTVAECHLAAQAVNEELWATQCAIATRRSIGGDQRSALAEAAAGVVDWLVSECPPASVSGLDV